MKSNGGGGDMSNESPIIALRDAAALNEYKTLLFEALRRDQSEEARAIKRMPSAEIPDAIIGLMREQADPTTANIMTTWLVKQYAKGSFP